MLVKTSELQGAALDWAVAKCENVENQGEGFIWFDQFDRQVSYSPSTDWEQGGPIIEREHITIKIGDWNTDTVPAISAIENWCARNGLDEMRDEETWQYGLTPLIAAMRCYVASKLGEEVDIPEGL